MNYYAQLDENGLCRCVSQLSGPVEADGLIAITADDYLQSDLLLRSYQAGQWSEKQEPEQTQTLNPQ